MSLTTSETAYQQRQEEAAFQKQLETFRTADYNDYNDFKQIEGYNGIEQYEAFKEAVEAMIEEVNSMKGSLYTQEGKNAQIRENLDKLVEEYIQKERDYMAELNRKLENLKQKLNDKLNESIYINAEETRLKMQDLEAEVRSQLAFATHQREVEGILRQLVERGERDKIAARFASKYAFMFAEKASSLADSHDRPASLHHIKMLAEQAKKQAYDEKSQARLAVLEKLNKKQVSGASKRLIEMNANTLKRKYQ